MQSPKQKFIFIGGGVASGIGKGITISSIAYLLKSAGYAISLIKIDPYLNIDAGTMAPREHGECYVLDDGGEVDLDLGNYERFLEVRFTNEHNITSGKIYQRILEKERNGDYLGKTVQVIPHVTNEIQDWIQKVAQKPVKVDNKGSTKIPDIILVELGGTVGDMESAAFYEAVRQLNLKQGRDNTMFILISYVPVFNGEEHKTKPTQNAISALRLTGLNADFVVLRSDSDCNVEVRSKIAQQANLMNDYVVSLANCGSLFEVPLKLDQSNMTLNILQRLNLPIRVPDIVNYKRFLKYQTKDLKDGKSLKIGVVGKYVAYQDCYLSVIKAIESTSWRAGVRVEIVLIDSQDLEKNDEQAWKNFKELNGFVIPGGYDIKGFEGKVIAANYARTNNIPLLGVCFGFQAMVIEFCRNVLKLEDATTFEFREKIVSKNYVITWMPDANLEILGGTMRKGAKPTYINDKNSMASKLYKGASVIMERYRHRYEVNEKYIEQITEKGLKFTGVDDSGRRMEILELPENDFYFGTQFHPEFTSTHFNPNPCYLGLILAADNNRLKTLTKGPILEDIKASWDSPPEE